MGTLSFIKRVLNKVVRLIEKSEHESNFSAVAEVDKSSILLGGAKHGELNIDFIIV